MCGVRGMGFNEQTEVAFCFLSPCLGGDECHLEGLFTMPCTPYIITSQCAFSSPVCFFCPCLVCCVFECTRVCMCVCVLRAGHGLEKTGANSVFCVLLCLSTQGRSSLRLHLINF